MDRLDTLDTLLFGKNKNIIFYDNWYLLQQEQKQQQQQQNITFTSNSIKKYFFLRSTGWTGGHPVQKQRRRIDK